MAHSARVGKSGFSRRASSVRAGSQAAGVPALPGDGRDVGGNGVDLLRGKVGPRMRVERRGEDAVVGAGRVAKRGRIC